MEGCLLCLELKQESIKNCIIINSPQWHELNIKNVLEKHLWTMAHLEDTSWLCTTCWKELFEFHKFYKRIEEGHIDFGLISQSILDVEINVYNKDECQSNEEAECSINEVEESTHDKLHESPVNELKELLKEYDNNLSIDIKSEEQTPLIKDEIIEEPLSKENPLEEKRKRGRPRKDNFIGTKKSKITLKKTKKYKKKRFNEVSNDHEVSKTIKKCYRKKINKILNNDIETNVNDISSEIKHEINLLSLSEDPNNLFDNDTDSNLDTDGEILERNDIKSKSSLDYPPKINHNEKDKFLEENFKITCFLCNIPMETFSNLRKHFEDCHTELGHVKCCNKKFYRRSILVDHVNFHLNPNYFKCKECGKVMADRRCLELHVEIHKSNHEKNHCCDICGKGFEKLGVLKKHRLIHLSEEEKRFSCSECGKNFGSKYMLSSHYRSVHLKKYAKICDICGKSIRSKDVFERHMLQHEGKTAPTISCDICGLVLTDNRAVKRHKEIIHPVGGQHEYTCLICSKVSPNMRAHKRHVQYKHEMGYDYKCTICEKAFKKAQTLKEHMASHTGTILYTCPWCPKTFNSNANMHNHRKKVHPKEWEEASRKRYSGNLPPNFKPPTITESSNFSETLDLQ